MNDAVSETLSLKHNEIRKPNGNGSLSSSRHDDEEIKDLTKQSKRIQELMDQIDLSPDSKLKELLQECTGEILSFYGKGLERILTIITRDSGSNATDIYNKLVSDNFVGGLLLIHDLHPLDLQTRLNLALEKVRPYMDSHGGNVEIVSLEDGIAKLKLSGSCKGCASSAVTLELAIKQAIEEHCPDLLRLDVEGVVALPSLSGKPQAKPANQSINSGWKTVNDIAVIENGSMKFLDINNTPLVIFKLQNQHYAYRNSCPACGMHLSEGSIKGTTVSCRLGHRYDIQQAGRCTDDPQLHLDPFPLINENGVIKVALG